MLQVRLLGQFDVRAEGKRVLIPRRAGQSLFAFLILTAGTAHRREKLAGLFWPEMADEAARRNLRQELWRIRKTFSTPPAAGEYLLAEEFTLSFNRNAEYWLDVTQLERADVDIPSLMANLSLYQGELLPGFYDEWIVLERQRIHAIFDEKIGQLLERLSAEERWMAVQEWGEKWIAFGSASEPAFRALMLAYGARGDMAKVAAVFKRCTDNLRDELGVEPSAETRTLYEGLLRGGRAPLRTRAVQPSGTVTFLFSDIEGSTRLLDTWPGQYAMILADHHAILRAALEKWTGHEVSTQGDAFFITFSRAVDAVRWAVEAQRALAAHAWPQGAIVRVRMGLHTGEPLVASTGYVGMDVHRAARIGDAGHGGQVLLSQTTRELVLHDLPDGVTLKDLGEHRLKDMRYPTPIYQLVIEGLQRDFAPLKSKFTGIEAPTPGEPPFKGLQYFDEDDAEWFFGRETLTAELLKRVRESHFLSMIVGASGSGKSSLVRAGLIPALKQAMEGGRENEGVGWRVHVITPTAHPLEALATEFTRDIESVTAPATLVDDLNKDPRSLRLFLRRQMSDRQLTASRRILLVVDQFEELFTLCHDDFEREAFIDNLLEAISGEGNGMTLVITLRADFYAHLAQYPELRAAVAKAQEYIGPMTTEELRRAVEQPARRGHWDFEPGLVDLILRDVGDEPGALPLLSHALLETWKRRSGQTMTLKGYAESGGVRGAIAQTAETVYTSLSPEQQTIARDIFIRLTELGEGTEDTRRRAALDELISNSERADEVRAVLTRLADARLVTTSEGTAEVAHEALIREWPLLREWLTQDREGLRLHRHLTAAAHEWELLERDTGALYQGARLAQAREWASANPNALNPQERAFLDASLVERERIEAEVTARRRRDEREQRARRRLQFAVIFGSLLLLLFGGLSWLALQQRSDAVQARESSFARELAFNAVVNLNVDPERSVLLALQSLRQAYTLEGEDAVRQALIAPLPQKVLLGHTDKVFGLAFSPDGKLLVSGGDDKTVRIWDVATGRPVTVLRDFQGWITSVAYSPNGKQLAFSTWDHTIRLWNTATASFTLTLNPGSAVHAVSFSPDSKYVVSASSNHMVQIWDTESGAWTMLGVHNDEVTHAAYSPDGRTMVSASSDGVRIWDQASREQLAVLHGHQGQVLFAEFSPDGKQVVTAGSDGTARLWDAASGRESLVLRGHTAAVDSAVFSPDGKYILTASDDSTARIWDAVTGGEQMILRGHTGTIEIAVYSPDGMQIATASDDGTIRVWNVTGQGEVHVPNAKNPLHAAAFSPDAKQIATAEMGGVHLRDAITGIETGVYRPDKPDTSALSVAFSPDGTRIASGMDNGLVYVWDLLTGQSLAAFAYSAHTPVPEELHWNRALWSPDGARIAITNFDPVLRIYDIETRQRFSTLIGFDNAFVSVAAFSPDGKRIATASFDNTARIWDVVSQLPIHDLRGHTAPLVSVAYSPDGKTIATGGADNTIRLWDASSGQSLAVLRGHASWVNGVHFSPDGTRLVSAGDDGTARIWDVQSGRELIILRGHRAGLLSAAYSGDGKQIITVSRDGTARVYLTHVEDIVTLAQSRVTRELTTDERAKYLHESVPATSASAIPNAAASATP